MLPECVPSQQLVCIFTAAGPHGTEMVLQEPGAEGAHSVKGDLAGRRQGPLALEQLDGGCLGRLAQLLRAAQPACLQADV